ncbi:MAG TPA: hypothetical protein VIH57_12870 [Bacteroidales bacterium]
MKKAIFIALAIFTMAATRAQKIKISDGNVLLDKVAIAKVEGKSGLFKKTDLLFSSLAGQPLLRVQEQRYDYFLETYDDLFWYEVENIKSGSKVAWAANANYSQKQLAEWLFVKTDPKLLKNDEIDTLAWNEFRKKTDVSSKIHADTIAYQEFETALIDRLKNAKRSGRDLGKPINFTQTSSNTFATRTVSSYKIYQDGYFIALLEKSVEKSSMGTEGYYRIYRPFDPVLTVGDKTYEKGLAGYMKISFTVPMLQITQLKKSIRADFATGDNSERAIVKYMVDNGYL